MAPTARSPRPDPLTATECSSAVTAITTAFGDPTRREIYLFAHERPDGVTASEVAERFELHPNVARHHLDKLASGGHGLNGYKGPMWDAWQRESLAWLAELKMIPSADARP